ncbi:MAG: hypothetical protein MSA90_12385 [Faecalicatena sp.]|uniref:hypothetical protein n=1 Tax=Faecalicatena sp. TaxID=2005360 RepID=UPI0025839BDF|nr:hypothetical protein [Faecalicatena sp.]MCI6466252.1 hypothetical protein [Faecalicatena sp.]MDY5620952.1 hypothetical protein [Lachnospiraceae bacterium]
MRKLVMIVFVFISLSFIGCQRLPNKNEKIIDIIEQFRKGNYEYTLKGYSYEPGQGEKCLYEMQGKLISDPYQQYEKGNMEEVYAYEKEGSIYRDIKLSTNDGKNKYITYKAEKGSELYIRDNLKFTYIRDEKVDDCKLSVFSSEYEKENVIADSNMRITLSCTIKLEYYVDLKTEVVQRIIVDLTESDKVDEIGGLILNGITEDDAKEIVDARSNMSSMKVVIDIKNFGGDIKINRPH